MSLDLIAASATFPGLATTGTQTFAGAKTWSTNSAGAVLYQFTNPGAGGLDLRLDGGAGAVLRWQKAGAEKVAMRTDISGDALYIQVANGAIDAAIVTQAGAWTLGTSAATAVGHTALGAVGFTVTGSNSGAQTALKVENTSNTASSTAAIRLWAGGANSNRTYMMYYDGAGANSWQTGVDYANVAGLGTDPFLFSWNANENFASGVFGAISTAGAWTFGPASGSANHTLRSDGAYILNLNAPSASTTSAMTFQREGTDKAFVGVGGAASDNLITGDLVDDFIIRNVSSGRLIFATSTTIKGICTSAGAWTLGISGSAAYFPGTRDSPGAAVMGTSNTQAKSLPANNTDAVFTIANTGFQTTGGGALCFVTEGVANRSVLFFVAGNGATTTITIISQTDAGYYVVGAPGAANKIGITLTNGSSASLTLTAGSSGFVATSVWLTCLTNAAGA